MHLILKAFYYALSAFILGKLYKAFLILLLNTLAEGQVPLIESITYFQVEYTWSFMISPLLMAPLFETSIVCYFLFRIYKKYNLQRWAIFRQWGFIIPSAVIFSLLHLIIPGAGYYRLGYTFIGGLLLAHLFLTTVKTHDINKAFWTTVLSHSFFNLFPFILSPIFM